MATIAEIRTKYPQYADMSDAALADALHKKFYADMPRADFDARVGLKPAAPSEVPGPRQRGFLETIGAPIEALSQGVISGGGNVMLGGQRLLGKGLSAVGATDTGAFLQEDAARRLAQSQATVAPFKKEFPVLTGTGELGGEILGTGPVGMATVSYTHLTLPTKRIV